MAISRFKGASKKGLSGWKAEYDGLTVRGDWATGEKEIIKDNEIYDFKRVQMQRAHEDGKKYQRQKQAAIECAETWAKLPETFAVTPYLIAKKVDNFDCKITGELLHVPARDENGKLWSVQTIDAQGNKMFYKGGKKKGCFHIIGNYDGPIIFCEGYATGASIAMACHNSVCVVICFDAFNLSTVIKNWRRSLASNFYLAADDDRWKPEIGNTGMAEAKYCCEKYGCTLIAPKFNSVDSYPTDFNDLHCLEGLGAVHDQIMESLNKP